MSVFVERDRVIYLFLSNAEGIYYVVGSPGTVVERGDPESRVLWDDSDSGEPVSVKNYNLARFKEVGSPV